MLKKVLLGAAATLLFAVAVPASASAQGMEGPEGHAATVRGTVIDLSCKFRHGLTGEDMHRMCAQVCADRGIPLAILGDDGVLYMPVSDGMPGEDQNDRLKEFAEQQVTISGTVYEAGGAKAVSIASVRRS